MEIFLITLVAVVILATIAGTVLMCLPSRVLGDVEELMQKKKKKDAEDSN